MRKEKAPHILLTGGGTLGPVTPLLAIYDEWKRQDPRTRFSWIGTPAGPEKSFLTVYPDIAFYALFAPKLSRHQKWKWPLLPLLFLVSLIWSYIHLRNLRPDIIYTVGGYVSVPIFLIGRLMGIPLWVHQLDVEPGLANKIMAKFAVRVTTTFEESARAMRGVCLGGMVRAMHGESEHAYAHFNLDAEKPTVLMIGGGTGATQLNDAMLAIKEDVLPLANIIHSFGRGKMPSGVHSSFGYYATELLTDDLADAYAAADVLIARGGLGTLLEAIAWKKPVLVVPIEGSHQEANARIIAEAAAGHVLTRMTPQLLLNNIRKVFERRLEREAMARNMGNLIPLGAERKIVAESKEILGI
jgi:UDP-N-acetylglucosamine--N-acetylmuramyl-(pentapeptide) pyrophosphoryl-undecaprenol N-acetylglucosamine transferase